MWIERYLLNRKLASSDPAARIQAAALLDAAADHARLMELAQQDLVPAVRAAAIARLMLPGDLEALKSRESDPEVLMDLVRRLDSLYADEALSACAEGRDSDAFDRISDLHTLITVALRADSPTLALAAGARLAENQAAWLELVEAIQDDAVALELYRRRAPAPDSSEADRLFAAAHSAALRNAIAAARIERQRQAEAAAAESALVAEAEACAADPRRGNFEELNRRWAMLNSDNEPLKQRFLAARYRYSQNVERMLAEQQAFQRAHELAATLTAAIESLPDNAQLKQLQLLGAEWRNAGLDHEPGAADFRERFRTRFEFFRQRSEARQKVTAGAMNTAARLLESFTAFLNAETVPEMAERQELLNELANAEASLEGELPLEFIEVKERIFAIEREIRRRIRVDAQARDFARWEHYTVKMDICAELEKLTAVEDANLPQAAKRFRALREAWNNTGAVPNEKFEELRERYHNACQTLHERLEKFFGERDAIRKSAEAEKLAICAEASALSASEDWDATGNRLKELQAQWKALPMAAPARERELFTQFHNACDAFFVRRNAVWEARKAGFQEAANRKRELVTAAEALKSVPFFQAKKEIANLRDAWREVPSAGRDDRSLLMEFNRIIDGIYSSHREASDEARRQSEIICTELGEILENTRSGILAPVAAERAMAENFHRWESLSSRPAPEVAERREAVENELKKLLESLHHREARHRLEEARELEAVVEAKVDPERLIDHLGRRLKVCGELEERLKECRILDSTGDLADALQSAITGNFGGGPAPLTLTELDEFLQRFVAVGQVPDEAREAVFERFTALYDRALKALCEPPPATEAVQ